MGYILSAGVFIMKYSEEVFATSLCHSLWKAGWVPYPELAGAADVIARHPESGDVIAIEAKLVAGFPVIQQAEKTLRYGVDGAFICLPAHCRQLRYAKLLCASLGIGVAVVQAAYVRGFGGPGVVVAVPAQRSQRCGGKHREELEELMAVPEARDYTVPGRKSPKQFTAFRARELRLHRLVEATPGMTPRELMVAESKATGSRTTKPTRGFVEYAERGIWDTLGLDEAGRAVVLHPWGSAEAGHGGVDYTGVGFGSDTAEDPFAPVERVAAAPIRA